MRDRSVLTPLAAGMLLANEPHLVLVDPHKRVPAGGLRNDAVDGRLPRGMIHMHTHNVAARAIDLFDSIRIEGLWNNIK